MKLQKDLKSYAPIEIIEQIMGDGLHGRKANGKNLLPQQRGHVPLNNSSAINKTAED